MKFRVVYTHRAIKDIEKLDPATRHRIDKAMLRYEEDPLAHAEKLTDPRLGTYRFRIGSYRVVFDLDGSDLVVLRVGHRKEIYRRK